MGTIGQALPGDLLRSAVLFDVFRPQPQRAGEAMPAGGLAQGEKSFAIRLTLGSDTEALTDAQIEAGVQAVLQALTHQTGARLR
jgi:phenylalanyl-tRNA synthetase beta chain